MCGSQLLQSTDYAALLELAEAGQLTLHCDYCDFTWTPDILDHKANADSLHERITQD